MNQKIRQVSLFDPPEEPRDETQKETTALISSVGADEGQPSTLNTNSIAQNVDPVTGFTIIFQGDADPVNSQSKFHSGNKQWDLQWEEKCG